MKLENNVITVEAVKALNAMQGGDRWTILRALGTTNTYVHVTDSVAAEQPLEEEALLKDVLKRVEKIKHNSKYYRLYIDEERDGAYALTNNNIVCLRAQIYGYYYPEKDIVLLGQYYVNYIDMVAAMTKNIRKTGTKVYITLKRDVSFEPISKKEYYKEQKTPKWVYACVHHVLENVIDTAFINEKDTSVKTEWEKTGSFSMQVCKTESLEEALEKVGEHRTFMQSVDEEGIVHPNKVTGVLAEYFKN